MAIANKFGKILVISLLTTFLLSLTIFYFAPYTNKRPSDVVESFVFFFLPILVIVFGLYYFKYETRVSFKEFAVRPLMTLGVVFFSIIAGPLLVNILIDALGIQILKQPIAYTPYTILLSAILFFIETLIVAIPLAILLGLWIPTKQKKKK